MAIGVQLTDNMRAPITKDTFELVVKTYWRSGVFFIELEYEKRNQGATSIVTATVSLKIIHSIVINIYKR